MSCETLKHLRHLSRPCDYFVSLDLADGYCTLGIREHERDFFTFNYRGGGGESRVRKAGPAKGGVVVGVDGECAKGMGVCTSVNECVLERDCGCAVDGDEDAVLLDMQTQLVWKVTHANVGAVTVTQT
jgi:hypothetical protein